MSEKMKTVVEKILGDKPEELWERTVEGPEEIQVDLPVKIALAGIGASLATQLVDALITIPFMKDAEAISVFAATLLTSIDHVKNVHVKGITYDAQDEE